MEVLVRYQYSGAGPRSPCACDLSPNLLGSSLSSAGSLTAQDTKTNVGLHINCSRRCFRIQTSKHILIKSPSQTFRTQIDDCIHIWTHTTSAFYVSRPDKKQSNTQTIHTRVQNRMSAMLCEVTHFLPYLFLLPLLLLSLFFLPDLGEALLLALQLRF